MNTTRTFDIGDQPRFTATFTDADGAPTDPATVTFMWRTPDGVETSYDWNGATEVDRSETGVFTFVPPVIAARGPHVCRVKSTGLVAADELVVTARRSEFTTP